MLTCRGIVLTLAVCILAVSCSTLRSGDLVFVQERSSGMVDAIEASTRSSSKDISFSHVGIVSKANDNTYYIIEADTKEGVRMTPIAEFLGEAATWRDNLPKAVFKRVKVSSAKAAEAAQRASSYIGRPYDYAYSPGDEALYCSELIWECYRDSEGRPIFTSRPMNFMDENGEYPKAWVEIFSRLGRPIPQGMPGTNPNDMSKESILRTLKVKVRRLLAR